MQVDEAGQEDEPLRVDALDSRGAVGRGIGADGGDDAVPDEDVGGVPAEGARSGDDEVAHAACPLVPLSDASRW